MSQKRNSKQVVHLGPPILWAMVQNSVTWDSLTPYTFYKQLLVLNCNDHCLMLGNLFWISTYDKQHVNKIEKFTKTFK
jgi:hypothetical protein